MISTSRRSPLGSAPALFALQALTVGLAILAQVVEPPPLIRVLVVAPAVLWSSGRSVVAGLGIRSEGSTTVMAVALSLVVLVASDLLGTVIRGSIPFIVAPLAAAAVLTPLALLDRERADDRHVDLGRAAVVLAGVVVIVAVLWAVVPRLPGSPQASYLDFAYRTPFSQLSGVLSARPNDLLTIPAAASEHYRQRHGPTGPRLHTGD